MVACLPADSTVSAAKTSWSVGGGLLFGSDCILPLFLKNECKSTLIPEVRGTSLVESSIREMREGCCFACQSGKSLASAGHTLGPRQSVNNRVSLVMEKVKQSACRVLKTEP